MAKITINIETPFFGYYEIQNEISSFCRSFPSDTKVKLSIVENDKPKMLDKEIKNHLNISNDFREIISNIYTDMLSNNCSSICTNLKDIIHEYCKNITIKTSVLKFSISDTFGIDYITGRYNTWDDDKYTMINKEKNGSYFRITREMIENALY